ncbi:MAG: ABC transporter ATP-binding protein [Candidatus Helarchaeota archaeon]
MNKTNSSEYSPEEDAFTKAREKGPKRWIITHIFHGSNKYLFTLTFFSVILSSSISSGMMIVLGMAINDFMLGNFFTLGFYTFVILVMAISAPALNMSNNFMREVLAQRMERDARKEFYANLLGKDQSFHDLQRIGDIMARATNDVRMLNFLISPALSLIIDSFTTLIVPIVFITLFYEPQLLITPLIFIVLFLISLRSYNNKMGPITRRLRQEFGQINAILNESLSGIEVVKGSSQEFQEMQKYFLNAKNYKDAFVDQGRVQAKYLPLLFVALTITIGFGHAVFLNLLGIMSIGEVISYTGLLTRLRFPTFISIFVFAIVRLAVSGAERLLETMNEKTDIDENVEGIVKKIQGHVKFENVSFAYPNSDKTVLKNVSFEVHPGQTLAIVGTTGSGKSTLTKLLSRLYDVSEGKIVIDGIDIKNYSLKSLREQISYIEQDIFLFSNSIFENISFGRTSSMEEVMAVARQAQAHDFIMALPHGYNSEVGEKGVQLSGGERQRIAIARSFLTDPAILVLDDSTSAIDSETEDHIQRAINRIRQDRTTFLITHRLSQIRWADLILVLRHGTIVAQGTHENLLEKSEEYRKIFVKRFNLDENEVRKRCV